MSTYYERFIACGQGVHTITVEGGVITASSISAATGFCHSYPNSDAHMLIGKPFKTVRGMGFRKIRMSAIDQARNEYEDIMDSHERGTYEYVD